ncbi:hypothetical protein Turpa_3142 [Turneriella parva DSM 21527]|uniref:Uncharacterized protein n=1 Tax=Turneriella parva (strain ATCC BAA-1111 / DSM 21527 / NCTC 11395 / H) TaxID=869212 RepID=I4B924_TURPD|nr:hypothetical protein Turpa_3142 [Turneriella parva DSM 21527]
MFCGATWLRVDLYPEFLEILAAAKGLVAGRRFFLWRGEHESEPEGVDFSFRPVVSEKLVERTLDKNACVLCTQRISYKRGQFSPQHPSQPYLMLVHNDFLGPRGGIYQNSEEDSLFGRMVERVLGFAPAEALVREVLRCHFAAEHLTNADLLQNCFSHLRADIEHYGIKGILLFGKAASLVFPDKAKLESMQGQVFEWQGVATTVCAGPGRLVYMREKGFAKEAIDAERQKIFAALTTFKEKIIGGV